MWKFYVFVLTTSLTLGLRAVRQCTPFHGNDVDKEVANTMTMLGNRRCDEVLGNGNTMRGWEQRHNEVWERNYHEKAL